MLDGVLKAKRQDKDDDRINDLMRCSCIVKIVLALRPFSLLTSRLESRDEILVSGGELSQP